MNEQEIFTAALEREPAERPAFVAQACGADAELRGRVEKLLRLHAEAGSFLESQANGRSATADLPVIERPGDQIGPYKLLQQIGEGGMGLVFMADQSEPVKRRVALKIIKPGLDTRQVIARFEAERQALAVMDHPNIAKVLDAGTTATGRPYFVMELVKGQPITQYCDERQLTPRQRLELLLPVCQAIQHAHQKGIIHRDIKPPNVLVAEYDEKAVPKVIDFGVAKAISQPLTERTMFTGYGQIVGTMEYMSPEQAKVNQLDIDTRSDIYSLGVLLYELLTGTTPFEKQRLRSAAWEEILRIIREVDPPKPSTRLSDSQDELPSIAARRRTEPAKLTRLVQGELDWIVMKALEKNRARRYATAAAMAEDLQRHLVNEPVHACPPSWAYRFRKTVTRHKKWLGTVAAIVVTLLVATVFSSWQAAIARIQRDMAAEAKRKAVAAADETASALRREQEARATAERASADVLRANQDLDQQLNLATIARLTARAQSFRATSPVRSNLLAVEALGVARREAPELLPAAHQALRDCLAELGGQPLVRHHEEVTQVAFSPDGHWLVTAGGSPDVGEVWLWDLRADDVNGRAIRLHGHPTSVWRTAFSPNSRWLATACRELSEPVTRLWDLAASDPTNTAIDLPTGSETGELAFTPDSLRLLTTPKYSRAPGVQSWDLTSARPQDTGSHLCAVKEGQQLNAMAVSGNGRWLMLAGGDVTNKSALIQLIDLQSPGNVDAPSPVHSLSGHSDVVAAAAISPDSQWLLAGSFDGTCRLWSLKEPLGAASYELKGHSAIVMDVAFSPDGLWAASASRDKTACLWRLTDHPDREPSFVLRGHESGLAILSISADSHYCVTAGMESQARVWDLTAADPSAESVVLKGHEAAIRDIAIDAQNRWIATVGDDAIPRLWRLPLAREAACDRVMRLGDAPVFCADLNRDGSRLVLGSRDGTVRVCELSPPSVIAPRELPKLGVPVSTVMASSDGRRVAAAGRLGSAGELSVWDVDANPPRPILNWRGQQRMPIAADPGVNWLIAGSSFNLSFWDLRGADNVNPARTELLTNEVYVFSVAVDRERRWLAAAGTRDMSARADGEIALWRCTDDGPSGAPLWLKGHQGLIYALTFAADGKWLASGSADRSVRLWDLSAEHPGSSPLILPTPEWVSDVAISNDGRWLVTGEGIGTTSGNASVWDLQSPDVVRSRQTLPVGNARVIGIAISPDNCRLAVASTDDALRVFSLQATDVAGSAVELHGHSGGLTSVRFMPDSRQVITTNFDGTAQIWELDLQRLQNWVTSHAGRELTLEERREDSLLPAEIVEAERLRQLAERDLDVAAVPAAIGHLREVIASYERAALASPAVRLYRNQLAEAYNRLATLLATAVDPAVRNLPESVALSTKAIAISPARDDFWQTLARAQLETGNLDEAVASIERALQLRPDQCDHLFVRAIIRFQRGDREASWRDYQQALTCVPAGEHDSARSRAKKLGSRAQETLGHPLAPDALEASRLAISEGDNHEARLEYQRAQVAYRRALVLREALYPVAPDRMRSRLAEALNLLAWSIVASRNAAPEQLPEALETATRAVQLAPNSWSPQNTLGVAQYRRGQWRDAMDTISRARPLETYHQDTAYDALLMAMAYHRLGESDEALAQLNAGREVIDRLQAADPSDRYLPALMAFSEEAEEVLSAVVGQNKP